MRPGLALLHSVGFLTVTFNCECGRDAISSKRQSMLGSQVAWGYGFIYRGVLGAIYVFWLPRRRAQLAP